MPTHSSPLLLVAVLSLSGCGPREAEPADAFALVDPFIGTGGAGFGSANCHPGATLPFGMVQVGPDTTRVGGVSDFDHAAGYHRADRQLLGFSHSRLSGVSTPDLGAVLITPGTLEPRALVPLDARTLPFAGVEERAEPGFYSVQLKAPAVLAELTATSRAAHHRYHFADGLPARLVFDVGYGITSTGVAAAHVEVVAPDRIEGWVEHRGRFSSQAVGGHKTFFSAVVSPVPTSWGTFKGETYDDAVPTRDGQKVGAVLTFDAPEVTVRLALSYVGVAGARGNLDAELPAGARFEDTRTAAAAAWRAQLSRLRFAGGDARTQQILATALYRAALAPNLHADVDGAYPGLDGAVRVATGHRQHHFFSLWDTSRTVHPLLSLIDPRRQRELADSLLQMGDDAGGALPRWTAGHASTSVTLGAPADVMLADSVLTGAGPPADRVLDLILASAEAPVPAGRPVPGREGVASYVRRGWVPADEESRSVSRTLEYAIADAAITRLARHVGRADVAARFAPRARSYAALFDPATRAFRGRNADGTFVARLDPLVYEEQGLYYGGNAAQYAWLAPHDPSGLLGLFGPPEAAADELERLFARGRQERERDPLSGLLPSSGYTQQNEHALHAAFLFLAAGRPERTQTWVQWIAATQYGTGADGLPGNEDAGALSAWFVWAAMGLYPNPGQGWYWLGVPLVDRLEVTRPDGALVISRRGEGPFVHDVTLDGERLPHPWVTHARLARGRALVFTMGETPGAFGRDFGRPPTADVDEPR